MARIQQQMISSKDVYVKGADNLAKTLMKASKEGFNRAMKKATREATKVIKRDAKAFAPHRTGSIERSISLKNRFSKSQGEYIGLVFTASNLAHLIEFGVKPHWIWRRKPGGRRRRGSGLVFTKGKVRHPGMKPEPFMVPAIIKNQDFILQRTNALMFDELKKIKGI
jgi:HK97 gp10 family phage protein